MCIRDRNQTCLIFHRKEKVQKKWITEPISLQTKKPKSRLPIWVVITFRQCRRVSRPVSYTHLDVYKRQVQGEAEVLGEDDVVVLRGEVAKLLALLERAPACRTALLTGAEIAQDVYKRQGCASACSGRSSFHRHRQAPVSRRAREWRPARWWTCG